MAMTSTDGPPARRVHPIVRLDHRVRVPAYVIVAAGLAVSFLERGAAPLTWAAMLLQTLGWPHVARALALRSRDTKRAELRNLLTDALFIGCWVAVVGFDPWLTTAYVISITVALLSVAGLRFSLLGLVVLATGSGATTLLAGLRPSLDSSPLTMGFGIACLLVYMSLFGLATNRQARHIVHSTKTIARQKAEIEERTALLEQARDEAERSLEQVRAFAEVTAAISASLDLRQVLDTVIRRAVVLSGSDAGAIFEFDAATRSFAGVASYHCPPKFLARIRGTPVDPTTGVIRRATETGQPFQIADVERAAEYIFRQETLAAGFRSLLAAPIPSRTITRGVVVFRRATGRFDPRVVELLVALANQSRVAISNARLFQEVQQQRSQLQSLSEKMEKLYRLSTAMQEPLSLREQLHRVLRAATEMGVIDRLFVWAVAPEGDRLVNLAGAGFTEAEWGDFAGAEIPLEEAGAMRVACRESKPLVFDAAHPLPPDLRLRPPYSGIRGARTRAFFVIPMIARGRTVGVLTGDNKTSRRPILPETVDLLGTFAAHAAVAIENARLFRESEEKGRALEIVSRHKSQFLANMSHELRTPLNAILGYTELIQDGIYGEVPPPIREVLERVQLSSRHLLGLVNDVLDLAKIEAGQLTLTLEDYSMNEIVATVVQSVEALAAEKGLALEVDVARDLPPGVGDERRLTQVLMNLVGNALKFTDAGRVQVEARLADGAFLVSVSDTGPGVPEAEQQRIFEEFHQADGSDTRRKGGTGLGLAIARRTVALHGGRLWVESQPGQGATFRFTVPVRVAPATVAGAG
ncbi:MAG TPA: ATP-binding protein [Candidatus Tectomicrobia bacterium]|nr:ATP-binding protein [Candidatus Tectomicrobia bacterium]